MWFTHLDLLCFHLMLITYAVVLFEYIEIYLTRNIWLCIIKKPDPLYLINNPKTTWLYACSCGSLSICLSNQQTMRWSMLGRRLFNISGEPKYSDQQHCSFWNSVIQCKHTTYIRITCEEWLPWCSRNYYSHFQVAWEILHDHWICFCILESDVMSSIKTSRNMPWNF